MKVKEVLNTISKDSHVYINDEHNQELSRLQNVNRGDLSLYILNHEVINTAADGFDTFTLTAKSLYLDLDTLQIGDIVNYDMIDLIENKLVNHTATIYANKNNILTLSKYGKEFYNFSHGYIYSNEHVRNFVQMTE